MASRIVDGVKMKQCCYCKQWFPATREFFSIDNRLSDGLCGRCKNCKGIPLEKPIVKEGYRICSKCFRELPLNDDYFHRNKKHANGFHSECKECRGIKFTPDNQKSTKEGYKICTSCGKEKPFDAFNKHAIGYLGLRPTCKECRSKERKTEKVRNQRNVSHQKRRSMKKNTVSNYSIDDWKKCLEFFNHQCAYCGASKDVFHKDHVIPISKGGGFIPSNIICACELCNITKGNRDVFKWFRKQPFYSLERERKIREFINCKQGEPMELALF